MAAFGWFLVAYDPKSGPIWTKLSPVMQYNVKYDICYEFTFTNENSKQLSQKNPFFGPF